MYKVFFNKNTKKEFLKLDKQTQKIVASKIIDLQNGNFSNDKQLYKKYKGKFRKKARNYRIIYLKKENAL